MAIRDSKELGSNLFLIARRLLSNNNLCRLLVNTDTNPLETVVKDPYSLLNKNVLVVPVVNEEDFSREGKIAIVYPTGSKNAENDEFKDLVIQIMIFTPFDTWIINDENLRPFMIMSEIEHSLKDKRINGIGVMRYNGFDITTITDKTSCYKMEFTINVFD